MTETKSNWGGKRAGSGKPKTGHTTQTVRVKKELVPLVKRINEIFKTTGKIPELKE